MGYGGIKKDADRANLLAYLQTLSDSPGALPRPVKAANLTEDLTPASCLPVFSFAAGVA